jgi:hypothetical protein
MEVECNNRIYPCMGCNYAGKWNAIIEYIPVWDVIMHGSGMQ